MSEPVLKQRSTIDLDDFERRLRLASAVPGSGRHDDPLAELARLVGEPYDPFGDVFAHEAAPAHAAAPVDAAYAAGQPVERREPGYAPDVPRLFGDFSAIEAGLRGNAPPTYAYPHPGQTDAGYVQAGQLPMDGEGEWLGSAHAVGQGVTRGDQGYGGQGYADPAHAGEGSRMRRPMVLMAASIAVGVLGIGAAFALKGRVASSPREVKTIMADASPTKIQPPPEAGADATGDAATFGRNNGAQPARLVSREEQPVDISQAVRDNVARAAQSTTDAANVPVPPPPGQGRAQPAAGHGDPIGDQVQGFGLSEMPAPKRVKVVSVRPDGTILRDDEAARPAKPGDKTGDRVGDRTGSVPKSATPKAATSKVTSRVAATAKTGDEPEKTIDQAAADGEDAPKAAHKAKPQHVASADVGDAEAPAAADGTFAVQLAAPGNEADARAASSRLSKKFSEALGGRHIGFRKADSNGKSVYRVRVSSLSRTEANSLCEKLKADGGSCFVAKN